jgi:EAL domain-containing protein (putative c-di-GMP-specific phosphodiesterase class I)
MLRDAIMPAAEGPILVIGGVVPFDAVPAPLLLAAFVLGVLTMLALLAARRSLTTRARRADPAETAHPAPAPACLGPAIGAAVRAGELQLHYQPKLDCRTSKVCGAEALSRWTLPDGTRLQPEEFVTKAETVGGIADLTLWGVERTLEDSGKLADGALGGPIFVNLSGKLITPEFAVRLIDLVGDQTRRIGFEITETAVLENPEKALECLFALRDAGLALAIDDYGAGLSSLSYLKQIPASELKIDRKFIQGMIRSNRDPLIVRSTIDLCHGLGMTVTAEGVEDAMTASLLGVMGCDTIQGYFVSAAVPIDELLRFVEEHRGKELRVPQIRKKAGFAKPAQGHP